MFGDSGSGKSTLKQRIQIEFSFYNCFTKEYQDSSPDFLIVDNAHLLEILEFYALLKKNFKFVVLLADKYLIPNEKYAAFNYLSNQIKQVTLTCKRKDCALTRNIINKQWFEMDETFFILKNANVEKELSNIKDIPIRNKKNITNDHFDSLIFVYEEEYISKQLMYFAASRALKKFLLITPKHTLKII